MTLHHSLAVKLMFFLNSEGIAAVSFKTKQKGRRTGNYVSKSFFHYKWAEDYVR